MKDDTEKKLLTANEISQCFDIPLNTIYRLSKNGKIRGIKIGKQWRYLKDDIERYLSTGTDFSLAPLRKSMEFSEKRQYPRMNCSSRCSYRITISSIKEFQSDTGSIRNISGGGVFLYDKPENLSHISIMDPVELEFEIQGKTGTKKIVTEGRAVREGECGTVINGLGIKFRNIDKVNQEEIINYVD